jgi:hypothetical protein
MHGGVTSDAAPAGRSPPFTTTTNRRDRYRHRVVLNLPRAVTLALGVVVEP